MTSNEPIRQAAFRRRQDVKLPKRRRHLALACLLIAALLCLPLIASNLFGSEDAATPMGSVTIVEPTELDRLAVLDRVASDIPDLLEGTTPAGQNPTVNVSTEEKPSQPKPKTIEVPAVEPLRPLDKSLTRDGQFGTMPAPNPAGLTPLAAYAAPSPSLDGRRPVSLIVGGLGINRMLTQRAIDELPPSVTLSFAVQTPGLQDWIDEARRKGHEVLLELPLEGTAFDTSDPNAERTLRTEASVAENRRNLHYLMSRAQGYAGVINYQGESLLRRSDVSGPILSELQTSGLGFLFDGSFEAPTLPSLSDTLGLPFGSSFGLIDPVPDRMRIDAELAELSLAAQTGDAPFGVGFAYPQTIDAAKGWVATLNADGLQLVPATAAIQ